MKRARDARTGRWVSLKEALRRPATTVIETVKRLVRMATQGRPNG
jgi:hypothetical protein